jgi:MarR family transcriptional regulator, organic hydroperoxide resistance regulator
MSQSKKADLARASVVSMRKLPAVALTIGRPEMLINGSDQKFRRLVQGVFTFAAVHEAIRDSYAAHVGLGGVQYTILQIIRHFGTDDDMSIGDIAEQLRLSGSFITNETKKLEMLGLVEKKQSKDDRRKILLAVSKKGAQLLDNLAPLQRKVNDVQFAGLSREQFLELLAMLEQLTDSSQAALTLLHYLKRAERAQTSGTETPKRSAKREPTRRGR